MHARNVAVPLVLSPAVIRMEAAGRCADDGHGVPDEARALQLVERGEAVAVLVLVDVEDIRARLAGRDA